ncbi:MAG: SDR family NAD(P)-dependent oxidoreductase [Tatlockia sp.]|jgi:NAD(P)-dependent dehydrogenase (short-subunit alcohol dehydrogenase family)
MQQKIIFITGCSTGIGYHAALDLTARGHRVIASCRKEKDVQALVDAGVEAVCMDVNDEASVAHAFASVLEKTAGQLDVLINNAGFGQAGALEDIPREVLRQQFETNVFGLMHLTQLAIPVMRKQGQGRIINISSVLGIIAMPFRGAYNASKYAVEGLSDTLRLELKPSNIAVITVEPGPINSKFRDNCIDYSLKQINTSGSHFKTQYQTMLTDYRAHKANSLFTKEPQAVINALIHAIEAKRPKAKYPVTLPAHLFSFLKRVLSVKRLDSLLLYFSRKELGPR